MASRRVEWRAGAGALGEVAPQWDDLVDHCAGAAAPYMSSGWLRCWAGAFGGRRRLVLCTVWEGSALVAGVPLLRSPGGRWAAPVNDHTPLFRPMAIDDAARSILVDGLLDNVTSTLEVRALPADDEFVTTLLAAASRRRLRAVVEAEHVSPLVDLTAGEAHYRAVVGSRLKEYERRRRKACREHAVRFDAVVRPQNLDQYVEAGLRLEAAGWKGTAGTAILSSPATERFYRELVQVLDAAGRLRLSALWIDGEMAAFDLALLDQGRYHLLKTGYDERLRTLAPGMLLRLAVIERCLELRLSAHEFLGPDMPWKRVFTDQARSHQAVRIQDRGIAGTSAHAYRRWVRPALRESYRAVQARRGARG